MTNAPTRLVTNPRVTALLLAAGASRRFGRDKRLARLADGASLIETSARKLVAVCDSVRVVLRPGDTELACQLAELGVECLINPQPERGLGRSLALGVAASDITDAWLVALADMPWILPASLAGLAEALRAGAELVAPFHDGRRGHPVGFGWRFRAELMALEGDQGARGLLERYGELLVRVAVEDAGVLRDVDVPGDLVAGRGCGEPG